MESFNDKVVVITGGATGIGLAFADKFGAAGAKLVVAGRREDRLREAADQLTAAGIEVVWRTCDVTNPEEVEALADFAWDRYGRVDVVVNNAGRGQEFSTVVDAPMDDVRGVMEVNFWGVWNGSQVFGRRLIEQGTPAAIYNVGSENSLFNGMPMAAAYVASKHAVLALTESLREEMPDFIEVGLICPGFVNTELGPPGSMDTAMPADRFVDIASDQILAGEFYIVSHAYNMERINARHTEIERAFATYAPRYDGDDEYDVRTFFAALTALGQEQPS
jgi:NAD(P)-dependent dehydrogenase (short-subunit alcohol dehydrogenase family)